MKDNPECSPSPAGPTLSLRPASMIISRCAVNHHFKGAPCELTGDHQRGQDTPGWKSEVPEKPETQEALFWGTLPPTKTFLRLKRVGGSINHCFCLKSFPSRASNERTKTSWTQTQLHTVPCTVSELLMMECRGSSFRSSAAWELNGRPTWELEARLCLGLQDWAGGLQGHRTGFPEKTNVRKNES